MDEHLVRLHIPIRGAMGDHEEFEKWTTLQEALDEAAQQAGVGYCDGNEIGGEEFTIWMYGPDADPLAELTKTTALDHNLPPGCSLFIRHGGLNDEGAREESYSIT
jgi:hypothetical protein